MWAITCLLLMISNKGTWIWALLARQRKLISKIDTLKRAASCKNACYLHTSTLILGFNLDVKCSNIRGRIADLGLQIYENKWFDKTAIRHRIFEYSGLTESKLTSLRMTWILIIGCFWLVDWIGIWFWVGHGLDWVVKHKVAWGNYCDISFVQ